MSDYPMLISNKLHSFRNFHLQNYNIFSCKYANGIYLSLFNRQMSGKQRNLMLLPGQCKNLRGKFINCYLCLQIHSLWS